MKIETIKINKGSALMIAHRGVSGLAKENSLASFELAGQSSHWGIETDVHVSKDKKYIIHHDENLKRCTGVDKVIEESNFDELRQIPLLGMADEVTIHKLYLPTLEEYLEICKKYNKHVVLELKTVMDEIDVLNIAKIVEDMGLFSETTFISFYPQNLIKLRKKYKNADIEFLSCGSPWYVKLLTFPLMRIYNFGLDIEQSLVTKRIVKKVHRMHKKINVWTVNDKDAAERLVSLGVDQITSNILE